MSYSLEFPEFVIIGSWQMFSWQNVPRADPSANQQETEEPIMQEQEITHEVHGPEAAHPESVTLSCKIHFSSSAHSILISNFLAG